MEIASRAIPVSDNLIHRNIKVNRYCHRCCNRVETGDHVFFTCKYAEAVWRRSGVPTAMLSNANVVLEDKLRFLISINQEQGIEETTRLLPFYIMWHLWKCRNELIFNLQNIEVTATLQRAISDAKEWIFSQKKHTYQLLTGNHRHHQNRGHLFRDKKIVVSFTMRMGEVQL